MGGKAVISVLSKSSCPGLGGKVNTLQARLILCCLLSGETQIPEVPQRKTDDVCHVKLSTVTLVCSFVPCVHCMQIKMVKTMSTRLAFEKS